MDLQNTFYLMAIILMSFGIVLLIAAVVLLFYIRKKIADLHHYVEEKVDDVVGVAMRPVEKIANIGSAFFRDRKTKKK